MYGASVKDKKIYHFSALIMLNGDTRPLLHNIDNKSKMSEKANLKSLYPVRP